MKTTAILKALGISYLYYDNLRERAFQEWCRIYSQKFAIPLSAMVKHDGLRNWYQTEWIKRVEEPFAHNYGDLFNKADGVLLKAVLIEYTYSIQDYWNQPILKMIKTESNGILGNQRTSGTRVSA